MPRYRVQWHIKAGGKRHEPGAVIELPEDQAAQALASGALIPASEARPPEPAPEPKRPKKGAA